MVSTSEFIKCVVVDILKGSLTSKEYSLLGGSPNIIRQCYDRNKGIGYGVAEVLSNLILQETKFDVIKKNLILDYLKQFLTIKEKEYLSRNENDIKTIMNFVAEKFNDRLKNSQNTSNKLTKNTEKFKVVDMDELMYMGWSIEEMTKANSGLAYETIDNLEELHIGSLEQWFKIYKKNPTSIRSFLDNKNNIIGYWHFQPLFDKVFIKAKNGKLMESEITSLKSS